MVLVRADLGQHLPAALALQAGGLGNEEVLSGLLVEGNRLNVGLRDDQDFRPFVS